MTYIYIELNGVTYLVGQIWSNFSTGKEQSSFRYDPAWLDYRLAFAIEPSLPLTTEIIPCKPDHRFFSGMADSCQDAWCRRMIKYYAGDNKQHEINYLLGMNDAVRFGALRYKRDPNGPFLATDTAENVPPIYKMHDLLNASREELTMLINPPEGLNVFRPKAAVIDENGELYVAKFSQPNDKNSFMLWEAVALTLANAAKISVPKLFVKQIHGNHVLFTQRFDRHGKKRLHYLSGIGMLNSRDDAKHSYLDLAALIREYCVNATADLHALWRRIVFNILISNFDDHLRNHGFLFNNGWSLAPLFDATPQPMFHTFRKLYTNIDSQHNDATLELALGVAFQFKLDLDAANTIIREVAEVTQSWRDIAKEFNIAAAEIEMFKQSFEHDELDYALKL